MRIGFSELITIGAIVVLLIGATRVFSGRNNTEPAPSKTKLTPTEARDQAILKARRNGFKNWGLVILALGVIFFLSSFGVFNYFFIWLRWGAVLIVLGIVLLFLPRRSR
jgi:hypothetical protein